jgi:hypothetical protein
MDYMDMKFIDNDDEDASMLNVMDDMYSEEILVIGQQSEVETGDNSGMQVQSFSFDWFVD